jgi:superfamily II DNA or RNA helicase
MVELSFAAGTLEVRGLPADAEPLPECRWDKRSSSFRAPALAYAAIVLALRKAGIGYEDHARAYTELESALVLRREARPFQTEALAAFRAGGGRGVVVLPTGAGKSHLGLLAIDDRRRSTLVVCPTLDLVRQWYDLLRTSFATEVGIVGGGSHDLKPLTVTTYDSAYLHMQYFGARFGLVIFDECHHLPGASYELSAEFCLAPFRLGLSATPERPDGREAVLSRLIGPTLYRKDIIELAGEYLRGSGIRLGSPRGWNDFLMRASQTAPGVRALAAYRRQRELSVAAAAKLDHVERLLSLHRRERTLIFTQDNATAYAVSRRFLVPVITHQTKVRERSDILERFSRAEYSVISTSKVLNEGVDVPDASVAIVISGSGSVREHVQRLGRVLRRRGDKQAILYELVSARTGETYTSERRRAHSAYQ